MGLRSRYREKIPAAETPEEPPQPSETVRVEFPNGQTEPAVAVVSQDQYPEPDEATLALQKQLADLKKSEELQKQYALHQAALAAQQHAQPPTHSQLLQAWRSQGADEGDLAFLESNPSLMDNPRLCRLASDEAAEHHQRGTDAHRQATKEIFDQHLARLQAQPAASVEPTPAFFQPPEPSRSPAPSPESIYSAPVSRGTPSGKSGYRPARTIKLTAQEQEYARVAGITDVEYAKQKQRLAQAKAAGDYGERR